MTTMAAPAMMPIAFTSRPTLRAPKLGPIGIVFAALGLGRADCPVGVAAGGAAPVAPVAVVEVVAVTT